MDDALWTELVSFTREEIGRPWFGKEQQLTPATRLFDDLRIDGVDAIEFVDRLFEKFDIKGDFPYARYVGPENATNFIFTVPFLSGMLFRTLFGRKPAPDLNPEYHPLTLGMLYEAARAGWWDTEAIEASQRLQP